eukprot:g15535.t1
MDHFKIVVTAALATLATLALLLVAVWSVWPRTAEASAAVAVHEFSFKHGDMAHRCDRFAPAHIDLVEAVAIHMLELNDVQQNDLAAIAASARRWQDVAQSTCRQLDVSSLDSGLAEAEKVLALIVLTVLSPLLSAAYWPETWPGWPRWLGLAPMLLGVLIASRASRQFTVADTNIVPFTAASALVTNGVFAWSRNPMYLGMIAFVGGLAWAVATPFGWVVAAGFAGVLRQQFVLREEQQMAATFGEAYRSYCCQGETGEQSAAPPAQPLSGMTVVEMTLAVQGPAVGVYLRDMGAEVIKVEPPLGDPSRYGRNRDNSLPEGTPGPQFVAVNRGKRSVCMDVGTELGARALRTLLEQADVFFSNYRTAALEELGLGFAAVHELNPTLIYAHVNGFGPQGPDADKAMLDGAAVARGGLLHHTGSADETPSLPGAIIGDTSGAMHLALGIVTALLARERGHGGQRVQTSALGTQMWLQQWEVTHVGMTGATLERSHSHHPNIRGPYGVYATSDGGAIMLAHTMQQEAWDAVCAFAECPELAIDPRFQAPGQRLGEGLTDEDSAEVRAALTRGFKLHTAEEWDAYLRTQPEAIWERR